MGELLTQYVDVNFVDALADMAPAVGVGMLLGFCIAIVGWVWGFVARLGRAEI